MQNQTLIIVLAVVTIGIVAVYAIVQRVRVAKAKDEHHHSAATEKRPELRDG